MNYSPLHAQATTAPCTASSPRRHDHGRHPNRWPPPKPGVAYRQARQRALHEMQTRADQEVTQGWPLRPEYALLPHAGHGSGTSAYRPDSQKAHGSCWSNAAPRAAVCAGQPPGLTAACLASPGGSNAGGELVASCWGCKPESCNAQDQIATTLGTPKDAEVSNNGSTRE